RTWTFTDSCDNTTSVSQTITVADTTAPTFTTPEDITLSCEEDYLDLNLTGDVFDEADNCATGLEATYQDEILTGECAGENLITRTWTLVDYCGNEMTDVQIITLMDTTAPELTTSFDIEIDATCDAIPVIPELSFTDNCGEIANVQFEETSTRQEGVVEDYVITRIWNVTDSCNNSSEFMQIVNVSVNTKQAALREIELCVEDAEIDLEQYLSSEIQRGGRWIIKEGVIDLIGSLISPSQTELGVYTIEYTETYSDCPIVQEFRITVHDDCVVQPCTTDDIVISKSVTPNGDAYYQYFEVNGANNCNFTKSVKIFNRWGTIIYESEDYQNNWDGTTTRNAVGKSTKVPSGTYYYIVELKNSGLAPIKGYIYVGTD
ncbi:gliding motility-associated C-terminal domain-containing protein, partial [Zhouia amylolytica]|uniref:gliding motility-associated C-terminal domain-containing protein n=1 Tax=Zhouia amylolytica TaxID=376730 RepID=UPI0020CF032F